jgi:hypothetical protein
VQEPANVTRLRDLDARSVLGQIMELHKDSYDIRLMAGEALARL